jgi:hypothetical protein
MIVLRLLTVFIFTALLTGCVVKDDIESLKTDVKSLRGILSALPTRMQCPEPGEHTTKICHYILEIVGPLNGHEDWYVTKIPQDVVQEAEADCMESKKTNPDMANHICIDPNRYQHWEYGVHVKGKVEKGNTYQFVNDPAEVHDMIVEKIIPKKDKG